MTNLQVYVGTYHKYNEGSIYGKWVDLSNYSDLGEFYKAIRELHKDEEDPEFMFQDYEVPELIKSLDLISEGYISMDIFEIIQAIEGSSYDEDVLEAYLVSFGYNGEDISEVIEKVDETYNGEYSSDEEFVQELLEGCGDIPANLPAYIHIDWERTARDIMYDYSESNGHYFRNL
ncbi:antirestriction protein ArdA [Maribacter aestuarii]|uniref:antirestriction protein ArdA n=1 Tax=Maribacter aestuarii TaxID=1130723 RepID=UPI00248CC9E0|nr:antirestriction protein ArdA [Maribacter aestuarii]